MKNTKQAMSVAVNNIGVALLVLLALFFIVMANTQSFARTTNYLDDLGLDRHLGARIEAAVTINEDLQERIPEPYLAYAANFVATVFRDGDTFSRVQSELYFVEPLDVVDPREYDHLHLMMSYYDRYNGLVIYIHNENTNEDLLLFSPEDDNWLLGRQVCVLPKQNDNSQDAKTVLADLLGITVSTEKSVDQAVLDNVVDIAGLSFDREDGKNRMTLEHDLDDTPIFIYEGNNNQDIPFVVLNNVVCFIGVQYGQDGNPVGFEGNQFIPDMRGDGYVWDGSIGFIQDRPSFALKDRVHIG